MKKNRTISQNEIQEKWFLIDASKQRIGKIASISAELLLGKTNPKAKSNLDPKSYVVIINTSKIDFTAKRGWSKFYKWYSGYPGGLRHKSLEDIFHEDPTYPILKAVKGMLPKNKKGDLVITRIRIFEDENHIHQAQNPEKIDITTYKV